MEITIKQRNIGFCNIKIMLMFLVVCGHFIEIRIDDSYILLVIYKLIYTIHMPMFVLLSGYFMRNTKQCINQAKKAFALYIVWQLIMYIVINYINIPIYAGGTKIDKLPMNTPFWHFWYLLSMTWWALAGAVILKLNKKLKIVAIIISVIIACIAGADVNIDREYSLSRTLVFMPYFLAGMIIPQNIEWHRYKKRGMLCLIMGIAIFTITFNKINYSFLWQAGTYAGKISEGIIMRLVCYLMAALFSFFILTNIPGRRFAFSKAGADTMNVYIYQGFIVTALNRTDMSNLYFGLFAVLVSMGIIYFIYRVFKWSGQVYSLPMKKEAMREEAAYGSI